MLIELSYQSELFAISGIGEEWPAPATVSLIAHETDLPVGTYYDSIWISSRWAINKPQSLIVQYDLIPGTVVPEMFVTPGSFTVPYQEDSGPQIIDGISIFNLNGGCMPWQIQEVMEWLDPQETSGDVPGATDFLIDPVGLGLGEYIGNVTVDAPDAVNNPILIPVVLQIWKLRGDVNWNGRLTIQDVVLLTDYLFESAPAPRPAQVVGDTNCDEIVSVADVSRLIDHLFISLDPICGNP